MKADRLMINDLVMYDGHPRRVTGVSRNGCNPILVENGRGSSDFCEADEVEPISLSVGILEHNGFVYERDYGQYWRSILRRERTVAQVGWTPSGKMYCYDISNNDRFCCFGKDTLSVHELQQVLRSCRLDDIADNFIIPEEYER